MWIFLILIDKTLKKQQISLPKSDYTNKAILQLSWSERLDR